MYFFHKRQVLIKSTSVLESLPLYYPTIITRYPIDTFTDQSHQLNYMKYYFSVLLVIALCGCKQNTDMTLSRESSALINKYLTYHPTGIIDIDDEVKLRFRSGFDIDRSALSDVRLTPSVSGSWSWVDSTTLVFKSEGVLEYDQLYGIEVNLDDVLHIEDTGVLEIPFYTRPLDLEIVRTKQSLKRDDNETSAVVTGVVQANQYIDPSLVKEKFKINGKTPSEELTWGDISHDQISFSILEKQEEKSKKLTLTVSNNKGRKSERIITISGYERFLLEQLEFDINRRDVIMARYSQPLDPLQNLRGLVKVDDKVEGVRAEVEGNYLKVYPDKSLTEDVTVFISKKVRSFTGSTQDNDIIRGVVVEPVYPSVRLVDQGVIAPGDGSVNFAFQAINLDTVDVEIFQIYEDNILQFLQDNSLSYTDSHLDYVGKIVYQGKEVVASNVATNTYQNVGVNLSGLIQTEPNALFQIRIGFRPSYVNYECGSAVEGYIAPKDKESIMSYRWYGYDQEDDPCQPGYYTPSNFIVSNLLISDIGATLKRNYDESYRAVVARISDGQPLDGAVVEIYSLQRRLLASAFTDQDGFADLTSVEDGRFAVVRHDEGVAYLKISDGEANSITDFNTGGKKDRPIDIMMYTDRGVYRPGDTIFMHAIVEDETNELPLDHPVTLSVIDAQGEHHLSTTTIQHLDHVYRFDIPTDQSDVTGRWTVHLDIGSNRYTKSVSVETVKPNRLRLSLDVTDRIDYTEAVDRAITISSSWLHGAPASNLRAKVDAKWSSFAPTFSNFGDYNFEDPARKVEDRILTLYEGALDSNGEKGFQLKLDEEQRYPAMLKASVTSRVFEKGGDFSENYSSLELSPYSTYVGMELPTTTWGYPKIDIGEDSYIDVVAVDSEGRPQQGRQLSVGVYDVDWSWWYRSAGYNRLYQLGNDSHTNAVITLESKTEDDGKVRITYDTDILNRGRKLIRVCDEESGHCTGMFIYASDWSTTMSSDERNALNKLVLSSDKSDYEVGDEVAITIPSQPDAQILVSLENGTGVQSMEWIEAQGETTTYRFEVTSDMTPNIYAHISLIQDYNQVSNDLPIRMYGILPIHVEDRSTKLQPVIHHSAEFEPSTSFTIDVSEEAGQDMTYTIAIVDEGLLDLTNFKTPDPHGYFYAKQSLGVKTWDTYDDILYGLNGGADKIISVGGDGDNEEAGGDKKAMRFRPVTFTAGPFRLKKGDRNSHTFSMPNYIGSVRAMVVARAGKAYGSAQSAVPVKSPLMLLPTVPRVVSIGEKVRIPISVFAMNDDISDVTVRINTSDNLNPTTDTEQLRFGQQGEKLAYFDVIVGEEVGIAKIELSASSGNYSSSQEIELDIRNPNPVVTESTEFVIESGSSWEDIVKAIGPIGTNEATLELSAMPQLNLGERIYYLVRYPYGCLEQTTSSVFPQLYLASLTDLIASERIDQNIRSGIDRIEKMQGGDGGFRYWPGSNSEVSPWANTYAGHFLIEARDKGHYVSPSKLKKWVNYQKNKSRVFSISNDTRSIKSDILNQAYRLYTLALYGTPDLSAMNNLRTDKNLSSTSRYLLAAAYALSSKNTISRDLINGITYDLPQYNELGGTYGSDIRDLSLIALSQMLVDQKSEAQQVIKKMIDRLNKKKWHSTQTLAFALTTIGKINNHSTRESIKAELRIGDELRQDIEYDKNIFALSFDPDEHLSKDISITNKTGKQLYGAIRISGQRNIEDALSQPALSSHVKLDVKYTDMDDRPLDVSSIPQGTDFKALVTISNPGTKDTYLDELALTQIVPSGWEIRSGRLDQIDVTQSKYDFRDVRDDRVHTFFDLGQKNKNFALILNATYEGDFILPPLKVEAMYDGSVIATTKAQKVSVVQPSSL